MEQGRKNDQVTEVSSFKQKLGWEQTFQSIQKRKQQQKIKFEQKFCELKNDAFSGKKKQSVRKRPKLKTFFETIKDGRLK